MQTKNESITYIPISKYNRDTGFAKTHKQRFFVILIFEIAN